MDLGSAHMLVLAGGFGSRIRSVIPNVPKPLAPIQGKPFLQYLLEAWRSQGVKNFTFALHYLPEKIISFLDAQKSSLLKGCSIDWVVEPEPLGTGGAIAHALRRGYLPERFLVSNADTWTGVSSLLSFQQASSPAMAITKVDDVSRFGQVMTENGKVRAFMEKNKGAGSGWINVGLYYLHVDNFMDWDGRSFSLEHDLFPELVSQDQLQVVCLDDAFIDIGVPEDYATFEEWIRKREVYR